MKISRSEEFHFGGSSHMWVAPTRELYVRGSPPPLRECYTSGITVHVSHTWAVREGLPSTIEGMLHVRALPCTWATCEPHVSCTWGAPLHLWGNATCEGITVHVSHTWAVREGLPSTIEEMLHVRALPCTWATRELYVRGSPPPLRKCYTWGHYHAREPHMRCTWVHELYVRGSSTIEEMLHVRALPCMWATREPHMNCTWGAPPYHWGNATREGITMHVSHTWAVHEGLPPPLRECYTWGHYRAREPHVGCTWEAPLHLWGNGTCEGITVHVSHTWAVHEGLPSTIEGMLHVRALPCTWATRELYVRGSPPPLRKCYTWGHYRACEPHVRCTWVCELYVRGSPPPLKKCYT